MEAEELPSLFLSQTNKDRFSDKPTSVSMALQAGVQVQCKYAMFEHSMNLELQTSGETSRYEWASLGATLQESLIPDSHKGNGSPPEGCNRHNHQCSWPRRTTLVQFAKPLLLEAVAHPTGGSGRFEPIWSPGHEDTSLAGMRRLQGSGCLRV